MFTGYYKIHGELKMKRKTISWLLDHREGLIEQAKHLSKQSCITASILGKIALINCFLNDKEWHYGLEVF